MDWRLRPTAAGRGYISTSRGGTGPNPLEWPAYGYELKSSVGATRADLLPRRVNRRALGACCTRPGHDWRLELPACRGGVRRARKVASSPELNVRDERYQLRANPLEEVAPSVWADRYLLELKSFCDANIRIERLRKTEGPRYLEHLDEDSEERGEVALAAEALEAHGFVGGAEHVFARKIVPRILSIQLNTGVGYAVSSAIQVVNAIMNTRSDNSTQWLSLYLIAAKSFDVDRHFRPEQVSRFREWRAEVVRQIEEGTPEYLRPARFDAILSLLFPAMARGLANEMGRVT